ncbi:hypothetical protein TeGR_g2488 [Tetraparma gracilis]|uniref:GrpE protein homolog n=1 Tax=Tetraparma gracilis TaxID=2962635 RepID=A0ABQ6MD32_9STRA|nr:hypothetical protein TeGR_g2488 [Tetraparma gracilis]
MRLLLLPLLLSLLPPSLPFLLPPSPPPANPAAGPAAGRLVRAPAAFRTRPSLALPARKKKAAPSPPTAKAAAPAAPAAPAAAPADEAPAADEAQAEVVSELPDSLSAEANATAANATAPPPEDPEVTSLKADISKLNADLAALQLQASSLRSQSQRYSKDGYVRLAAEVDNFKKAAAGRGREAEARESAGVVGKIMEVYEELDEVGVRYLGGDPEGSEARVARSYDALKANLMAKLRGLGLREFHAAVGEKRDAGRHDVIEGGGGGEFCTEVKEGCVKREVGEGWELGGEVVRRAKVVLSKGAEKVEEEEVEEEAEEQAEEGQAEEQAEEEQAEEEQEAAEQA